MTTTTPPVTLDDVREAAARLKGVAHRTPVLRSRTLDALVGALTAGGLEERLVRVAARTLLHFVLGHVADEQTHLQAGSAGAIPDEPRESSDFAVGLAIVVDGIRTRQATRQGSTTAP